MKNLVKDLRNLVVSVSPDPSSIDLPPVGYQLDLKHKTVTHTKDIIEDCYSGSKYRFFQLFLPTIINHQLLTNRN